MNSRRFSSNSLPRRGIACAIFVGMMSSALWCQAQGVVDERKEANVKAVFLYSFGRYVRWPDPRPGPFVIGILGETSTHFDDALKRIAERRKIGGRPIEVRQFSEPADIAGCRILFLAADPSPEVERRVLEQVAGRPVLVVGESPGLAERGAAINFYLSGDTVRFEINDAVARRHALKLDAKLLNLGRRVPTR